MPISNPLARPDSGRSSSQGGTPSAHDSQLKTELTLRPDVRKAQELAQIEKLAADLKETGHIPKNTLPESSLLSDADATGAAINVEGKRRAASFSLVDDSPIVEKSTYFPKTAAESPDLRFQDKSAQDIANEFKTDLAPIDLDEDEDSNNDEQIAA